MADVVGGCDSPSSAFFLFTRIENVKSLYICITTTVVARLLAHGIAYLLTLLN